MSTQHPHVLVIDDEPMFGRMMAQACKQSGYDVTVCATVDELAKCEMASFDVAILDYDLGLHGVANGVELAVYLSGYMTDGTFILVSQKPELGHQALPKVIKNFVPKSLGPHAVLRAAFGAKALAPAKAEA